MNQENEDAQEYVSIIGMNYTLPISSLVEKILDEERLPPIDTATVYDNGYSVGIIVLTILMLESFVRRASLVLEDEYDNVFKYIKNTFSDYSRIDILEELFVLRDAIVHNHLWSMNASWDERGIMHVSDINHLAGGDKKYKRVIDQETHRTKILKMRLRPTCICFEEAFIVLHETYMFFEYLESKNRNIIYLDAIIIKYGNKALRFPQFIKEIPKLKESSVF